MSEILWKPKTADAAASQMYEFMGFVNDRHNGVLGDYAALHRWSVENVSQFWEDAAAYLKIKFTTPHTRVIDSFETAPGRQWFEGATLNFAENLLRFNDDHVAIRFADESGRRRNISYKELRTAAGRLAAHLAARGIGPGDVVGGFMPNLPETVIAMLATSWLGAAWTSTSADFGARTVLDRFEQTRPKVLFIADGYPYKGKWHACGAKAAEIVAGLPSVEHVIGVDYAGIGFDNPRIDCTLFSGIVNSNAPPPPFAQLPFMAPLYVMYSSGTTGAPKCIVHGAGGTLLQHRKEQALHADLRREDTILYYTTCGWMMWNWLMSALATGATMVLYEGSPFHPKPDALWELADELGITVFGTSARYLIECNRLKLRPIDARMLGTVRSILSTGSTLPEAEFDYVYDSVKRDVQLSSIAGGTDLISCFALGNPLLPVRRGELQCKGLGMAVAAFDENGRPVVGEQGELVCTKPFVSMPIGFANDPDGEKYRTAYFARFPGNWHHGDFVEETPEGGLRFFGRSDATLNPGGVRIGTSEIYRVVDELDEIEDSLAVGRANGDDEDVVLFVKAAPSHTLTPQVEKAIRDKIRGNCSPRHVPARIRQVAEIPYTHNGKKVELAVKNILHGKPVANESALANPASLDEYRAIAREWQ